LGERHHSHDDFGRPITPKVRKGRPDAAWNSWPAVEGGGPWRTVSSENRVWKQSTGSFGYTGNTVFLRRGRPGLVSDRALFRVMGNESLTETQKARVLDRAIDSLRRAGRRRTEPANAPRHLRAGAQRRLPTPTSTESSSVLQHNNSHVRAVTTPPTNQRGSHQAIRINSDRDTCRAIQLGQIVCRVMNWAMPGTV